MRPIPYAVARPIVYNVAIIPGARRIAGRTEPATP